MILLAFIPARAVPQIQSLPLVSDVRLGKVLVREHFKSTHQITKKGPRPTSIRRMFTATRVWKIENMQYRAY